MKHNDRSLADTNGTGTPEDVEVVRVFDAYLAEVQAGRPPDPERLLAEHPALADRLRAFLNVTDHVDRVAGDPEPTIEDYRIIGEIGRGGMGIVYEAEQISRGRRVALKVLPTAAALDPRQLRRFQVEIQAAQLLRHPHIVPIAAFGCERGVYYYAMQYIEGRNLAALICDLRQLSGLESSAGEASTVGRSPVEDIGSGPFAPEPPQIPPGDGAHRPLLPAGEKVPEGRMRGRGPSIASNSPDTTRTRDHSREVARWGQQAAEALDHAHGQGVLHRDIKPSNLLIDAHGHLWVTDFGLAQVHGEDGGTLTGDLLGTLRYMSPEQALAKRVVIDGRTDIYSLGATLYELLTLHPAFEGRDRHELLRRSAQEEPRPPRRFSPAIPRDLETIVLKAMSKDRDDRYAAASDMAADLQQFLENCRSRPDVARWWNASPGGRSGTSSSLRRASECCC